MKPQYSSFTGENYPLLLLAIDNLERLTKKLRTHTAAFQAESEFVDRHNNKQLLDHLENYKLSNNIDSQNFNYMFGTIQKIIESSLGVNVSTSTKPPKNAWDVGLEYIIAVPNVFTITCQFDKTPTLETKEISASITIEDMFVAMLVQKGVSENWIHNELSKFVQHEFVDQPNKTTYTMAFTESLRKNLPLTEIDEQVVKLLSKCK
ncbi:hypothetical protein [Photobacterium damselae]|uniref:hypothetical protein n=1 Tax=Photobacterium damselae TaxID=38293 RepID=UPI004067ABF0